MGTAMRTGVIKRQITAMTERGLDAVISISPENFAYLTGFVVPSQPLMRWRHAAAVLDADGNTALLAVDMEETTIHVQAPDMSLHVWGEFTDNAMDVLAGLLKDMGLSRSQIGLEFDYLPGGDLLRLQQQMPEATFVPVEDMLARLRQIKDPEEIELLRRLSRISDGAISSAFAAVKAGMTEMDIAGHLTRGVYELGATHFKLMIVATGERSMLPNVGPTTRKLIPGDICRVEIFSIIDGYHAGVCRTAVVGEPGKEAKDIWSKLVECKYLVLDMIKPGASSRQVYEAFLTKMREADLPPISFVGHGIGLHLHEEPYLGKYSDTPLMENMVLGIEPLVYRTPFGFGMQLKDMVRVSKGGAELLSDHTNTDELTRIDA